MTQLLIKLQQPWVQGHLESGALAVVQLVADAGGHVTKAHYRQEKPVSAEGGFGQVPPTVFDLPGGGYYEVQIDRPRGADISREFFVKEGEVRTETIVMEGSPHEFLGWQQFAGIVDASQTKAMQQPTSGAGSPFESKTGPPKATPPTVYKATMPRSEAAWGRVEDAARTKNRGWACTMPLSWAPQEDPNFVAWFPPMPDFGEGVELVGRLKDKDSPIESSDQKFPRWLSFNADGQIDLVSVPWAWWGGQRAPDEEIRFVYDRLQPGCVDRASPGRVKLSVQDSRWFGLLEFLASGRMNSASKLIGAVLPKESPEALYHAEGALSGKVKGPLVAVAGGIVLLACADSTEQQEWDSWLENLSRWFPGIPDGPILLGCRRVQRAKGPDDLTVAYNNLREGIQRGVPFFSASIRLLSMALAQIGDDIPSADEDRRTIASVSTRVDPDQPFTVIRL